MTELIKRDFHAKPFHASAIISECNGAVPAPNGCQFDHILTAKGDLEFQKVFKEKDVLAEREHYEKQIKDLKEALRRMTLKKGSVEFSNFSLKEFAQYHYDEQKKRAEAAEKEAEANANGWKIEREELEKSERKREKAEARVKELESEVLGISNDFYVYMNLYGSNVNPIKAEELGDRLRALAGEKTK